MKALSSAPLPFIVNPGMLCPFFMQYSRKTMFTLTSFQLLQQTKEEYPIFLFHIIFLISACLGELAAGRRLLIMESPNGSLRKKGIWLYAI
jgi:hypothetical protein